MRLHQKMARRFPKNRSVSRRLGTKKPKSLFIIVCEGKNTEPHYFTSFANDHGNSLVSLELAGGAGAPLTIVEKAVHSKKSEFTKSKKSGFDSFFEVWAVFDVDEHPNIPQAVDMANGNDVKVGVSNPCFEIWPLLHMEFHRAAIHRHALQKKLAKSMTSYEDGGSKIIDYNLIKDSYGDAKGRAENLLKEHRKVGACGANPSTNIFKLLDRIIEQGKPKS